MHYYAYLHMHVYRGACKTVCKHTDEVADNSEISSLRQSHQ